MMYLEIASKLFFGLIALIALTRLLGKKTMSQLTPFDFVYAVVLGGLLEETIYAKETNVTHLWFAIALWGIMMYLIEKGTGKFDILRIWIKGEPSIMMKNGVFNTDELRKSKLDMEQLRTVLRQQGIFDINEVKDIVLETSGKFSVNPYKKQGSVTPEMLGLDPTEDHLSYLFVDKGDLNKNMLERLDKSEDWLSEQLKEKGYPALKDLLYVDWSPENGFRVKTRKDQEPEPSRTN